MLTRIYTVGNKAGALANITETIQKEIKRNRIYTENISKQRDSLKCLRIHAIRLPKGEKGMRGRKYLKI